MHWLGEISQTTAAICYRSTADVDCYAVVGDRQSQAVAADTATDDGVIRLDVSGLLPGKDYAYSIFADGVKVATGALSTMPADGEKFAIAYLSCWRHDRPSQWVYDAISAHPVPIRLIVFLGDTPYVDVPASSSTLWGETRQGLKFEIQDRVDSEFAGVTADYDYTDAAEVAAIQANYFGAMRSFRAMPGVKALIERYATIWLADDHEYPGDNGNREDWDNFNDFTTGSDIVANATQAGELMDLCRASYRAYFKGNPANNDSGNDPAYDADDQCYFRMPINSVAELFFVDTIWYKTADGDAADVRKIIGDTQRGWLTDQVVASQAVSKLIFTPADMTGTMWRSAAQETGAHPQTAGVSDAGERDVITQALDGISVIAFLAGDTHHTNISVHNGLPCLNACPVDSSNAAFGDRLDGRTFIKGGLSNDQNWNGCFGVVDVLADGLQHWFYEKYGRTIRNAGRQYTGSNELICPRVAAN